MPLPRLDRPELAAPTPTEPDWLQAFRLQVAARAPRLAPCFEGASAPGHLRWSAAVEPRRGTVSDHLLEPLLPEDVITTEARDCALAVLSDPPYRLPSEDAPTTPTRVALVLTF